MALHDSLRELVAARGAAVVDDASELRGALDDFLAEDEASVGELNLLVDAVRLGGLDRLLTMLDNGAAPAAAVAEAGSALARDRGSDDSRRASWAVAALGYALGRVEAPLVERTRPTGEPQEERRPAPPPPPPSPRPEPSRGTVGSPDAVPTALEGRRDSAPVPPSARRRPRRSAALLAVSFAVVLGLVGGIGLALWMERNPTTTADDPAGDPSARKDKQPAQAIRPSMIVVSYTDAADASRIYQVDPATGDATPLTDGTADRLPAVSPDRTQIAYLQAKPPSPLVIQDLAETDPDGPFPDTGPCATTSRPGWSPDGSRLAIICGGTDGEADGMYVGEADGGGVSELFGGGSELNGSPTWVADDSFIFGRADDDGDPASLWLFDLSDGAQTQLTLEEARGRLSHADWSADREQLLFLVHRDDTEFGEVWISDDVSLETARPLPGGHIYAHPAWAPTGDDIVATVMDEGVEKLATFSTTTSETPSVIEPPAPDWTVGVPAWGTR